MDYKDLDKHLLAMEYYEKTLLRFEDDGWL